MRREGTEELAVRRERKLLSSHSVGKGTGPTPPQKGIKNCHSVKARVCVFASWEGDTHPTHLTCYRLTVVYLLL